MNFLSVLPASIGLMSIFLVSGFVLSTTASERLQGQVTESPDQEQAKLLLPKLTWDQDDTVTLHLAVDPDGELLVEKSQTLADWSPVTTWQREGKRLRLQDPTVSEESKRFYRVRDASPMATLQRAQKKWEALGITDYQARFRWSCFCIPDYVEPVFLTVRENRIIKADYAEKEGSVPASDLSRYETVEGLFDWIADALDQGAHSVQVDYHPQFGYPISGWIDFESNLADEEKGFELDLVGTPSVLLTNEDPEGIRKDPIDLGEISTKGLQLEVEMIYSGGCREHFFGLFMSPPDFQESFPPQARLYVRHTGQNDPCEAVIHETQTFDLRLVAERYRKLYREGGPLRLHIDGFAPGGQHPTREVLVEIQ